MMARLFVVLLTCCPALLPCVCPGWPTPKEAWSKSAVVFAGLVQIANIVHDPLELRSTVVVQEAFKGVKAGDEVAILQPWDSCVPKLRTGEKVVLYLTPSAQHNTWQIPRCHRSRAIEDAASDLAFLRGLPDSATRNRLTIVATQYENSFDAGLRHKGPVANAAVQVRSASREYKGVTDGNGLFEMPNPGGDDYDVGIIPPEGLRVDAATSVGLTLQNSRLSGSSMHLRLAPDSDAAFEYALVSDNSITGRIVNADGSPCVGVGVFVHPLVQKSNALRLSSFTEVDGSFEFKNVPAGQVLLVINERGGITAAEPYPTLYYPGVSDRAQAVPIKVRDGQHVKDLAFRLPAPPPRVTISGHVLFQDGQPAPKALVAVNYRAGGSDATSTVADGTFELTVLANHLATIRASISLQNYGGPGPDCGTELRRLLAERKEAWESKSADLALANTAQKGLVLNLPVRSCRPDALQP